MGIERYLFLKRKYKQTESYLGSDNVWKLDFSRIEEQVPELAQELVFLRSRVKELSANFHSDAMRNWRYFICTLGLGAILGLVAVVVALGTATEHIGNSRANLPALLASFGSIASLAAGVLGSLGFHKKFSAMFHAHWALKALQMRIDQFAYGVALRSAKDGLSSEDRTTLRAKVDAWLDFYTEILTSFGEKYGASVSMPYATDVRLSSKAAG